MNKLERLEVVATQLLQTSLPVSTRSLVASLIYPGPSKQEWAKEKTHTGTGKNCMGDQRNHMVEYRRSSTAFLSSSPRWRKGSRLMWEVSHEGRCRRETLLKEDVSLGEEGSLKSQCQTG